MTSEMVEVVFGLAYMSLYIKLLELKIWIKKVIKWREINISNFNMLTIFCWHANRFEYAFPEYVKNVILTERRSTVFYTNSWITNFKWKILSISPSKLPAQTSTNAEEKYRFEYVN